MNSVDTSFLRRKAGAQVIHYYDYMNRKLKAWPEIPTGILLENTHIIGLLVGEDQNARNNSIILGN